MHSIQVSNSGNLSNIVKFVLANGSFPANQPPAAPATAPGPPPAPAPTGAIYYVSNSGSDSNSGTSQRSAWKTIAKVQSSLGNLKAGNSILFERGGMWYEELDVNNVNGAPGLPITFGSYGSGNRPIIDGGGTKSGNKIGRAHV